MPAYPSEQIVREPTELERYDSAASFLSPISDYTAQHETMNALREKGALTIYFKQGSSTIDPGFSTNDAILTQVNKVINLIQSDTTAKLDRIVMLGFAFKRFLSL